jgi:hypothetical protein
LIPPQRWKVLKKVLLAVVQAAVASVVARRGSTFRTAAARGTASVAGRQLQIAALSTC